MPERWIVAACLLLPQAAFACEHESLTVDTEASSVTFTVTQGDAPFSGEFHHFGGNICLDENAVPILIDAWLDPASVDTGLPEVDELLFEPEFFRTAEFPRVTFASDSIELDGNHVEASGPLTINGISRAYDIEFTFEPRSDRQWNAAGKFTLLRLEHELGRGEWDNTDYLDNAVEVSFDALLVPSRLVPSKGHE